MFKFFLFPLVLLTFVMDLDAKSDVILKVDTLAHSDRIKDLVVTKDKHIITASSDKTIRIFDSKTGKEIRKLLGHIGPGPEGTINAIALSPDEKYLAVGGYFRGDSIYQEMRIYNYQTAKIHKVIGEFENPVNSLSFSPDGKYLISGAHTRAKIWSVDQDFKLTDTIHYHQNIVYSTKIFIDKNQYYAVTAGYDNVIALYDIQKHKVIKTFKAPFKLSSISVSNKHIAASGLGNNIFIFDLQLNEVQVIENKSRPSAIAYSDDGTSLISGAGAFPLQIILYDATQGYQIKNVFQHHDDLTQAVGFIDNDTAVSAGGRNHIVYIWNQTGIVNKIISAGKRVHSVGIQGDNIAWGNTYNTGKPELKLDSSLQASFDLKSLTLKSIKRTQTNFNPIQKKKGDHTISHRELVVDSQEYGVLDIKKSGELVYSVIKDATKGSTHTRYGWYKNFIISGSRFGDIQVYNNRGKIIATLQGHTGKINALALDGDRLISGSSDQMIKIWDLSSLDYNDWNKKIHPLLSLFFATEEIQSNELDEPLVAKIMEAYKISKQQVINDAKVILQQTGMNIYKNIIRPTDWVIWTEEGFFNASKNGSQYIGYHINQGKNKEAEYITVEMLYDTFYRPDLIQKALNGESLIKYAKNINIDKLLKSGLAPVVKILTASQKTKKQDLNLKVQVCPKTGGYNNLALMINGMPVSVIDTNRALKIKRKAQKRNDCFVYDKSISLVGGINEIGFKATNKDGTIESNTDVIEVAFDDSKLKNELRSKLAKIKGDQNINDLHILAIAINEYKDDDLKLNYSINDATEMLKTIQTVAKPLFHKVHTYKLFDKKVTKANIKKAFKKIQSTREDVFLLYIAGHGITDEYNGNYYYIPYDFINKDDDNAVQTQGVGQKDLMLGLSNITALKSLVLLDTCNSGSFVEANMQKTTTDRLSKATGRATLSASSKSQVALEGFKGHGVFTYTLLEALKGKGYGNDENLSINELSDYVHNILPARTYDKWGYKQMPQRSMYGVDFNLGKQHRKM